MTQYQNLMGDYEELLGNIEGCEAWASYFLFKPIPISILSEVLKRSRFELRAFTDMKSIRRFIRNVSQQGTDKEEKISREYLGKRLFGEGFLNEELEIITGKKKVAAAPKAFKLPPEFENNCAEIILESGDELSNGKKSNTKKSEAFFPKKIGESDPTVEHRSGSRRRTSHL
jgi:hypothetical protein